MRRPRSGRPWHRLAGGGRGGKGGGEGGEGGGEGGGGGGEGSTRSNHNIVTPRTDDAGAVYFQIFGPVIVWG